MDGLLGNEGILVEGLDDHFHGHRRFADVPDIVVGDMRHHGITHLGLAGQECFRGGSHAHDGHAPGAESVGLGLG